MHQILGYISKDMNSKFYGSLSSDFGDISQIGPIPSVS